MQEGRLYDSGYMCSIFDKIPSIDLMYVMIDLNRDNIKFGNNSTTMTYILTKYIESVGYQEFKELLPYILG